MTLVLRGNVSLPAHTAGGFDHGDVHASIGRVFVAHTANSTVAVIDGAGLLLERTLPGCTEASGVRCAPGEPDAVWYSAAAKSLYVAIGNPGVVDVLDASALSIVQQVTTEEGAHTSAFDSQRGRLYVFLPKRCQAAVYEETSPPATCAD